ncbi:hypothetical protein KIPB_008936 [Kipferlia bialata]|uniref:Uncharacterized protein n=1 Tax=Kipferlia bialata TaxID=797122 RepID=A0A9K3D1E9_9EUKA|nr:hypothetical protein KIPB_008936 [Kipferlia bialata]|eukprot:g8936.t1
MEPGDKESGTELPPEVLTTQELCSQLEIDPSRLGMLNSITSEVMALLPPELQPYYRQLRPSVPVRAAGPRTSEAYRTQTFSSRAKIRDRGSSVSMETTRMSESGVGGSMTPHQRLSQRPARPVSASLMRPTLASAARLVETQDKTVKIAQKREESPSARNSVGRHVPTFRYPMYTLYVHIYAKHAQRRIRELELTASQAGDMAQTARTQAAKAEERSKNETEHLRQKLAQREAELQDRGRWHWRETVLFNIL